MYFKNKMLISFRLAMLPILVPKGNTQRELLEYELLEPTYLKYVIDI